MRTLCLLLLALLAAPSFAADAFPLRDGDRVVFLGNTLFEREQRSGWWELALTARHPGKKVSFRNLGWSGDTVFGEARVGYAYTRTGTASVAGGFKHLKEHTLSLKPTVILIAYGTNESFEGPAGLPKFVKGLNTLLDTLAPAKARVVLFSPLRQGTMPAPLPDPTTANKNLRLYADAIRDVAQKRGLGFVDLYERLGDIGARRGVTDNGIHLTERGYAWSAKELEQALGIATPEASVEVDLKTKTVKATRAKAELLFDKEGIRIRLLEAPLGQKWNLSVKGLPVDAQLVAGGQRVTAGGRGSWDLGLGIDRGPVFDQYERLRQAIVAKNELYFHRWRPQNETYLFGFRKHEQGKNAIEIPQFDPLVAAKEKEIHRLSRLVPHTYELKSDVR